MYYLESEESMKTQANTKKHTVRNVFLIILALLIIAGAVLAFVYRDYLKHVSSLYKGMTHSSEEISSMQAENDKKTNELLNELAVETMRDLTDEERKKLASGELSASDAISLIQGLMPPLDIEITAGTAAEVTSGGEKAEVTTAAKPVTKPEPIPSEREIQLRNRISEIIAEIYLLRATYLNKIDDLIASTKQEYNALPKEQKNLQGKMRLIEKSLIPKGNALEKECDTSMNVLLTELRSILKELKMGTDIITEIQNTYREQKDLKMAELYGQYSSKLN